ncbi:MAG TPA: hypothetical protein VE053_06425 [Allosphingosinicella sp.]|nr:hypothetical protein [Allosphingosinicella sp.]
MKRLSAAGMEARQAEALAEALTAHAFDELATKDDLKDLELRLTIRMGALAAGIVAILGALITFS